MSKVYEQRGLHGSGGRLKSKAAVQPGPYRPKVDKQRGAHGPMCRPKPKAAYHPGPYRRNDRKPIGSAETEACDAARAV